ncbi:MAG: hypothetical protein ACRD9R_17085 [Pyrinomonadaceae bacterium]
MKKTANPSSPRRLTITRIRQQGRDTRSFDMRPAAADTAAKGDAATTRPRVTYLPGQVAVLRPGAQSLPSYFAFASAPDDPELEFLIKRTDGKPGDEGPTLYQLKEGDEVELVEVAGHGFPLGEHEGRDLVFVAMGTGVAPLRSALRHALGRPEDFGQIVVLYGARTPEDFCYQDEVEAWQAAGVELRRVISRPDGYEWAGSIGYVQSLLDNVLPGLSDPLALVCGSPEMIAHTRDRLHEMGLAPENILTNY